MCFTCHNGEEMVDRFKICRGGTPVPHGYKECPECGKLLKLRGYGGHMYGVHGIRTGDKARLNMVYEWFLATTRERDTGIIRIPDNKVADKFYGLKQS